MKQYKVLCTSITGKHQILFKDKVYPANAFMHTDDHLKNGHIIEAVIKVEDEVKPENE